MTKVSPPLYKMSVFHDDFDRSVAKEIQRGLWAGMTQAQIAEAMDVAPSTIARFIARNRNKFDMREGQSDGNRS